MGAGEGMASGEAVAQSASAARAMTGALTLQTSVRMAPGSSAGASRPMRSSVGPGGHRQHHELRAAHRPHGSVGHLGDRGGPERLPRRRRARASSPTTRPMPARRACQASDPPIAPRPMTASEDGRTAQLPLKFETQRISPPERGGCGRRLMTENRSALYRDADRFSTRRSDRAPGSRMSTCESRCRVVRREHGPKRRPKV